MSTIKVSVVVPVFNAERYLEKCIKSLQQQTLKEIEIICVNDGSSDNSLDILNRLAEQDSRIVIIDKENEGQSVARNVGISRAQGEFLGFVDSDDWVDKDFYEKLYGAAIQTNSEIASAGYKRWGKIKSSIRKSFKKQDICTDINDKLKKDCLPRDNFVWNKIYKRDKWNFNFAQGRCYEDTAIMIQILYHYQQMVTVPNTYYNYRKNSTSTSTKKSLKHHEDYNWALEQMYSFAKEHGISLDTTSSTDKKETYKVFNLTVLKVYYQGNIVQYKLFGFIPFLKKIVF